MLLGGSRLGLKMVLLSHLLGVFAYFLVGIVDSIDLSSNPTVVVWVAKVWLGTTWI